MAQSSTRSGFEFEFSNSTVQSRIWIWKPPLWRPRLPRIAPAFAHGACVHALACHLRRRAPRASTLTPGPRQGAAAHAAFCRPHSHLRPAAPRAAAPPLPPPQVFMSTCTRPLSFVRWSQSEALRAFAPPRPLPLQVFMSTYTLPSVYGVPCSSQEQQMSSWISGGRGMTRRQTPLTLLLWVREVLCALPSAPAAPVLPANPVRWARVCSFC